MNYDAMLQRARVRALTGDVEEGAELADEAAEELLGNVLEEEDFFFSRIEVLMFKFFVRYTSLSEYQLKKPTMRLCFELMGSFQPDSCTGLEIDEEGPVRKAFEIVASMPELARIDAYSALFDAAEKYKAAEHSRNATCAEILSKGASARGGYVYPYAHNLCEGPVCKRPCKKKNAPNSFYFEGSFEDSEEEPVYFGLDGLDEDPIPAPEDAFKELVRLTRKYERLCATGCVADPEFGALFDETEKLVESTVLSLGDLEDCEEDPILFCTLEFFVRYIAQSPAYTGVRKLEACEGAARALFLNGGFYRKKFEMLSDNPDDPAAEAWDHFSSMNIAMQMDALLQAYEIFGEEM